MPLYANIVPWLYGFSDILLDVRAMSETSFKNWAEWKEKCDLRKCTEETQDILLLYVRKRWRRLTDDAIRKAKVGHIALQELDGWTCWDLFESYYADLQGRTHKVYKDYIFDRIRTSPKSPVDTIESSVFFHLLGALIDYVQYHYHRAIVDSLDAGIDGDDDAFAPYAYNRVVLPEQENPTVDDVTTREYHRIAPEIAQTFFPELSHRLRVSFVARELGLPLSHPEVERIAGCKKSVLRDKYNALILKLGSFLKAEYPQDDAYCLFDLVISCLKDMCCRWVRTETSCAGLFLVVEARKIAHD